MKKAMAAIVMALSLWGVGAARADYDKGLQAFEARDYKAAMAELMPLAEQGDARSQYLIGVMHRTGVIGVVNREKAREWLQRAAEAGHAEAQYTLGLMYFQGEVAAPAESGASESRKAAVELFRAAAQRGHTDAQLYLGHLYSDGIGIRRDPVEALKWYQLAAWQRSSVANAALDDLQTRLTAEEIARGKARAREWMPMGEEAGRR